MIQNYRLLITIIAILFGQDVINYNFFVYVFIFLIIFLSIYILLDWYYVLDSTDIYEINENFDFFDKSLIKTKNKLNTMELPDDSDDENDISISISNLKYTENNNNKNNNKINK